MPTFPLLTKEGVRGRYTRHNQSPQNFPRRTVDGVLTGRGIEAAFAGRVVLTVDEITVPPGQVTVLIGPNASGKSTLVRSLCGAVVPQKGTVTLPNGGDLRHTRAADVARQIAFVPQASVHPFAFTVGELVGLGASVRGTQGGSGETQAGRVETALALVGLTGFGGRNLSGLSGGERQRAALARAFAQQTPCLLLDEPTAALDVRHQVEVMGAARNLAHGEGVAALVVLHDLNLAAAFADTVVLLSEGRIVATGAPADVLTAAHLVPVYQTPLSTLQDPATGQWLIYAAP